MGGHAAWFIDEGLVCQTGKSMNTIRLDFGFLVMILINLKPNDGIYVKTKEHTLIRNDMKSDV